MNHIFYLGEDFLTTETAIEIIHGKKSLQFSASAQKKINNSVQKVQEIISSDRVVYGVNTGFGPLCRVKISPEETTQLQENILKSHAVGVGEPIDDDLVRLMLLTKLHALAKGYSGIQFSTLERILFFLENEILPVVPAQGSVGASGDLAPLAHLFLPLIGLGKVKVQHKIINASELESEFKLKSLTLSAKEGLALINGTQFILAHAVKAVEKLKQTLENADVVGALMLDALRGSVKPFQEELHQIRPYSGTQQVAKNLRELLRNSEIPNSHADCGRVQDPYSLRCMPQVHGASRNAWQHLKELTEIELNSVTDNPIVLENGEAISGGNFHGQPLAMVLDYTTLAAAELGNIADRRVYLSLEGEKVNLPKLLLEETGLNSGFMILQYTTAALVSENKSLCFPASADSIPTSMGQEDHVSMGSISGRKCLQVIENVQKIQAIELLCACQALEFVHPLKTSPQLEKVYATVREKVPYFKNDELFSEAIENCLALIQENKIIRL